MTIPFIEMQDVAFAYGDRPILNNVNLNIRQGALAAIMGGSGSGKTTLMYRITGQIQSPGRAKAGRPRFWPRSRTASCTNTVAAWG